MAGMFVNRSNDFSFVVTNLCLFFGECRDMSFCNYKILGVIDWEGTCFVPWELLEFLFFLLITSLPMDGSWKLRFEWAAKKSQGKADVGGIESCM